MMFLLIFGSDDLRTVWNPLRLDETGAKERAYAGDPGDTICPWHHDFRAR
jgi:hypothetical protein